MIATTRLVLVLAVMLPLTVLLMPVQLVAVWLKLPLANNLPVFWHRLFCRLIGVKVTVIGEISKHPYRLLIANHTSWSDIIVLGSVAPVSFIAKQEVAMIPFAGLLAKLQRSVFVRREDRRATAEQAREIHDRMVEGDSMVLFAEGTTTDGQRIARLNSSLFGAAEMALRAPDIDAVDVQSVTICYTRCHGIPLGRLMRARSSWPGDIGLAPHGAYFIKQSAWDVEIRFGEPIRFTGQYRRRALADKCQQEMRRLYSASAHGKAV